MLPVPSLKRSVIYIIDATDLPLRAITATASDVVFSVRTYSQSSSDTMEDFLSRLGVKKNSKVIFIHSGKNAATFSASVRLERQKGSAPLIEADVASIFRKAALQFFNRFSDKAKKRFKTDNFGVVLVNSRVLNLRLDGETYIDPIGIRAGYADVSIEQTFLRREMLETTHSAFHQTSTILHIEVGSALYELSKFLGRAQEGFLIAYLASTRTSLYSINRGAQSLYAAEPLLKYREELDYGAQNIFQALWEKLGVEESNAYVFLERLLHGPVSHRLTSLAKKVIRETVAPQLHEYFSVFKSGTILLFTEEPLASFLEKCGLSGDDSYFIPSALQEKDIMHHQIKFSPRKVPLSALSPVFLAGFIAYLYRLGDNYDAFLGRETIRWLTPHNSL